MQVIPAYHPAFILRQNMRFSGLVEEAFKRAVAAAKGHRPKWDESEFVLPQHEGFDADKVVAVLRSMHGREVAFDVETDGKHPLECALRCIAFYDGKQGITVPLLYRDGTREDVEVETKSGKLRTESRAVWTPYYSGKTLKKVLGAIQALFASRGTTFLTQNGQYDRTVVKARWGIDVDTGFDTMLAHHLVSPYLPHDLGFLAALYTDAPYYKATAGGDSWSSESDNELWLYNCRDVKVTWLVAQKLKDELLEVVQNRVLFEHDTWQERECQRWQETGIELDPHALAFFRQHYSAVAKKAMAAMRKVVEKRLKKADADAAADQPEGMLQALLDKLMEKADVETVDDSGEVVEYFNPASLQQLRLLLGALGIPLKERTATGELSTAKEFLTGARKELLAMGVKDDRVAFLDYLFAWRESSKVLSTYLHPEVLADGRVHPSFSVHVTPTGRLSSSRPNFQNQPAEIRGMFIARKGHVLVSMDWDALEMRLGALNSEDPNYIEAFAAYDEKRGPKPHIVNMSVIFGVPATKEAAEKSPHLYRAAKVFAYAGAYGATDSTMYEQMREEMPDLQFATFKVAVNNYKKRYARLFEFQNQVVLQGTREGFIDSGILKRRSYYFEPAIGHRSLEASAMQNFPYQCLQGSTRVLVREGYKRINQLAPRVTAWTGQRWAPAKVIKKGVVPLYRARFTNGVELEVDATHHFLVDVTQAHFWVQTTKLAPGDRVALDLARAHDADVPSSEKSIELAYLAGFYTGNGSVSGGDVSLIVGDSPSRHPSRKPRHLIPKLANLLAKNHLHMKARDVEGCTVISLHRDADVETFLHLTGIDPTQKAHTKRVPEWVWSAGYEARCAFLKGLLDADGTIGPDKDVRLHLCQRELLQECWLLARTCGVTGSIYGPAKADAAGHLAWTLVLNAAQSWEHLVQWTKKRPRLKPTQLAPTWCAQQALEGRKYMRGSSHQVLASRVRRGGSTGPYTLLAMGGQHAELYDYTTVESVEPLDREETVYTLSVDDPQHRYVGEGVIAKNSTGADVVGLANRRIMERLVLPWRKSKLKPGEVLEQLAQVHDELLFEVPERLAEEFKKALKAIAEEAPPGKPKWRLPVDIKVSRRWKPVQTRCKECFETLDVEMTAPDVWEGGCEKKHHTRIEVLDAVT